LALVLVGASACSPTQPTSASGLGAVTADTLSGKGGTSKKKPPAAWPAFSGDVSLATSDWVRTAYAGAPSTPSHPFDFPLVGTTNYLHYTRGQWALAEGQTLSATYTVTASPDAVFRGDGTQPANCVEHGYPPQAQLVLWTTSFDYSEYTRWWAMDTMTPLAPGTFTLTQTIDPSRFMSALGQYGTDVPAIWSAALSRVVGVGLSAGFGCYLGHGVGLSAGAATFTLTRYAIL
jgi:hypothetical protein